MTYDATEYTAKLSLIQRNAALLLNLPHPNEIVLSPGVLVALRLFFAATGVRRILLSEEEYYGPAHFHGADVRVEPITSIASASQSWRPDAVIVSALTWRGRVIDIQRLFADIRFACGERIPLLVADGSHLGAAGFPAVNEMGADLVCGDYGKWLMSPSEGKNGLAFLAASNSDLAGSVVSTFQCFFLATSIPTHEFSARWIDPHQIDAVHATLTALSLTRESIAAWHSRNQELMTEVATEQGIPPNESASILWLPGSGRETELFGRLDSAGLVWHQPQKGVRVLCRADILRSRAVPGRTG